MLYYASLTIKALKEQSSGGAGDFTTISAAITFIKGLNSTDYPDKDNRLIYVSPELIKNLRPSLYH